VALITQMKKLEFLKKEREKYLDEMIFFSKQRMYLVKEKQLSHFFSLYFERRESEWFN